MSKVPLKNSRGEVLGEVEIADGLLVLDRGDQAVHDAVVAYRARGRAGTASTKGKGAVAGTGKKPWRQKGTGRARAGYARSPVWRGGGVAHGPHPRDFGRALPKKAARLAFARAFSARVAEGAVSVLDGVAVPEPPKTRAVADLLKTLGAPRGLLLVVDRVEPNLALAARNLPGVEIAAASDVNTYMVLRWPAMAVTRTAMAVIERRLAAAGRKSA